MGRKIVGTTLIILFILIAGVYVYIQGLKPAYSGKKTLPGLKSEVQVYFDDYGVPHIYADNTLDAYYALGYVHAQDRLWQMELVRRIAPGRLSEIFGSAALPSDKLFRTLSLNEYAKASVERFKKESSTELQTIVNTYLRGINFFQHTGPKPVEFTILGIDPEPFTLIDVYNTLGYMAFSFAMAHRTEPIVDMIKNRFGPRYLQDLDIHVNDSTTFIESYGYNENLISISTHVSKIINGLPAPPLIGSNSWVIGPQKSASGKVILANDPHMGFAQPAVWYEAHITAPGIDQYGFYLAGFPFPNIFHNQDIAVGITMFENDDIDLFRERINPDDDSEYLISGQWKKFSSREEIIKVKDSADFVMHVRESYHGPVINDAIEIIQDDHPITISWIYLLEPNQIIQASYQLTQVKSPDQAASAVSLIHSPGLNIMYGDKNGNFAWWATGKLWKRPAHVNSKTILDGSTGEDDPLGYYGFIDNPQSINPEWGYVYSANNQTIMPNGEKPPGYYLPEDRAKRIIQLLEGSDDWNANDVKKMILDVQSSNVPEIIKTILPYLDLSKNEESNLSFAIKILETWDGNFGVHEIAPTIYNKWIYKILQSSLSDELGEEVFDAFLSTHLLKRSIQKIVASPESPWWDDLHTNEKKEDIQWIISNAFEEGIIELESQLGKNIESWQWGKVHTLEHAHTFSAAKTLKRFFHVGPFQVPGNSEVINNLQFTPNPEGVYNVNAGPSTRRIIDFDNIGNNSWTISPTGQSGNPLSKHYKDQAEMYANGEFRKMWMNEDSIRAVSNGVLLLKPRE